MKKILSLFVLLTAFCTVSFAQMTSKVASKAMLLPANTQIKDGRTGQVLRVTKGTVPISTTNRKVKVKMTKSGTNTPANSKKPSGNLLKQRPVQH